MLIWLAGPNHCTNCLEFNFYRMRRFQYSPFSVGGMINRIAISHLTVSIGTSIRKQYSMMQVLEANIISVYHRDERVLRNFSPNLGVFVLFLQPSFAMNIRVLFVLLYSQFISYYFSPVRDTAVFFSSLLRLNSTHQYAPDPFRKTAYQDGGQLVSYNHSSQHVAAREQLPLLYTNDSYQYVHDTFRKNGFKRGERFISHDPLFKPLSYTLKENIQWNNVSVCQRDTFVLMMYFVYRNDRSRRKLIRKYVKQGMKIRGKRIAYVFVTCANHNEAGILESLRKENRRYGDILISIHKDDVFHLPLTVFDAFLWVREHCKNTVFVCKVDADVWVNYNNLLPILKSAPQEKYATGSVKRGYVKKVQVRYKNVLFYPKDYPVRYYVFLLGGGTILSRDVIPFINIGTQYMELIWPGAEDIMIGEILRRAGIKIKSTKNTEIVFKKRWQKGINRRKVFIHVDKNLKEIRQIYKKYRTGF